MTKADLNAVPHYEVEIAYQQNTELGEGAIWHPARKTLLWVNIEGKQLNEFDPSTGENRAWGMESRTSTVVPESDSTCVVTLQNKVIRFNLNEGTLTLIAMVDDLDGGVRCNDGKCDPQGRLWTGTMVMDGEPLSGVLYRIDRDGSQHRMVEGVTCSNGLVWSHDHKWFYYIDTPTQKVECYAYDDATGDIRFERTAVVIPREMGSPDGMTIDAEGMLWVCHWGGEGVYRWNPLTGELLGKVDVPSKNVTSCAFGGPDYMTLYITTAYDEATKEQYPHGGSLFVAKPEIKGVAPYYYKAQ